MQRPDSLVNINEFQIYLIVVDMGGIGVAL